MIVIVGAGLAGLVCARELTRAGHRVEVLEREDDPGGRVRTTVTREGFRLDHGFQVPFAAYPALLRHVRLNDLQPRYFQSGLEVADGNHVQVLGHPLFAPQLLAATLRSGLIARGDVGVLTRILATSAPLGDAPLRSTSMDSIGYLRASGMSDMLLERVFAPLFGGISLDASLSSDATFLQFVIRYFSLGRSFVPALGVQELADNLARSLPPGVLRFGVEVESVLQQGDMAGGVRTSVGEIEARSVVIATDWPAACRLGVVDLPPGGRSCTTLYVRSARPLGDVPRLILNATGSLVNEVVPISLVAPEYAPDSHHLTAMTALSVLEGSEERIAGAMLSDLREWYAPARRWTADVVGLQRVPFAQFAQPPGIYERLPGPLTGTRGLYRCGEYLHSSSIQGAMRGGELAASALLGEM